MVYKINWWFVKVPKDNSTKSDRRTKHKSRQVGTNKIFYKFVFYPHSISDWNSLPGAIGMSDTLESFKGSICYC